MNTASLLLRLACGLGLGLGLASAAWADPLRCDLGAYKGAPDLIAGVDGDVLTVSWAGADGALLRAQYAIEAAQPLVRELAIQPAGGSWRVLGANLSPDIKIHSGRRRMSRDQLPSLKAAGVDTNDPAIQEREAWVAFWDAPFVVPGENGAPANEGIHASLGPPRTAAEIQRVRASFNTTACSVRTDGARLEVEFPGLSAGIFTGGLRFTVYRGTNLLRMEAIASTSQPRVAYKYDAGLDGFSIGALPQLNWTDTGGSPQAYGFGGALNDSLVTVRARNRVMSAEGAAGSIAVFPPPTVFFPTREVDTNLGYVWYRKDSADHFGIGVKQADHEDDPRYLFNYALYNAPPGTKQRMAVYFYLSAGTGEKARGEVLDFTHRDHFQPLPGYKVMVNHFHIQFTDRLRASGSLDTQTPDLAAMKALGINIVGLSDFHADKLHLNDTGELRLADQHDYYEGTRRASDKDFLVAPWEEPSVYFGAHYNLVTPRPVYWTKRQAPGQPFIEQNPKYGKVYHPGSLTEMEAMLEAEDAYWFHAHPRTKSTSGYPDAVQDKEWVRSDRYLGVAFKPGMGMDLSEARQCEWRCFDVIDGLNNRLAGTGALPKYIISDADTYQKWPHDDIFPGLPVTYVKLDRTPGPDESWAPILKSLRGGDFFVTNGEILISNYAVEGKGKTRTISADVQWTFPLEFLEVVSGDGKTVEHKLIRATDLPPFGSKRFSVPFDAKGKKWVRLAVWDSAVNGAFVPAQWLEPGPRKR